MSQKMRDIAGLKALKKIGFITPSSNTALEPLTAAMAYQLRDQVSVHFGRLPVTTVSLDNKDIAQFEPEKMVESALLLNDAGIDTLLWNGTSGSWTGKGFAADEEICQLLNRRTGLPISTTSLALLEVLRRYGIRKFGLAVPYVEAPTQKAIETYEREGFQVVRQARLNETVNINIGNTSLERIRQLLRDADSPDAECIVVACTNLPAALVLDEMEAELGKPIFDSIAVTLWKALQIVGVHTPIHGWGKLLRENPVLVELERIMATLHKTTSCSRTTLRIDIPAHNCHVDTVSAEAVSPGVRPLKLDSSLNQHSLNTVQWLKKTNRMLVQEDCVNAEVPPPLALMDVYGVKAQMLVPLAWGDHLAGWISVHHIGSTRAWQEDEMAALRTAAEQTRAVLEKSQWVALPT